MTTKCPEKDRIDHIEKRVNEHSKAQTESITSTNAFMKEIRRILAGMDKNQGKIFDILSQRTEEIITLQNNDRHQSEAIKILEKEGKEERKFWGRWILITLFGLVVSLCGFIYKINIAI